MVLQLAQTVVLRVSDLRSWHPHIEIWMEEGKEIVNPRSRGCDLAIRMGLGDWTLYDIPASVTSLPVGAGTGDGKNLPSGAKQGNDAGVAAAMGGCPPLGSAHRYVFKITALKVEKLNLPAGASGAMIGFITKVNSLGTASITATFGQ